jgi:hypothetical protein
MTTVADHLAAWSEDPDVTIFWSGLGAFDGPTARSASATSRVVS